MDSILLLGSSGMLGQALAKQLSICGYTLYCPGRQKGQYSLNILDSDSLSRVFHEIHPDIVINAAANVDLNACENNPEDAYLINGRLVGQLAELCREQNSYLVQVSTDHYYSGDGSKKHSENDRVELINEYARSKYCGECFALTYDNSLILRTNIVGFRGKGKPTFLEWAMQEIIQGRVMTLFTDFYTSSMHTADFARILSDLLSLHPVGILNLASNEVSNKRDFIVAFGQKVLGVNPEYREGSVKNLSGTPRAESLGLDTSKIESLLGYQMPDLQKTMDSILEEYKVREINHEV